MQQQYLSKCYRVFCILLALFCLCEVASAQDEKFHYQFIPLNPLITPLPGYNFIEPDPTGINGKRQVALTINYCLEPPSEKDRTCTQSVGFYEDGAIQILQQEAISGSINNKGVIGGAVVYQAPDGPGLQPALFRQSALPEMIPQPQGVGRAQVSGLTNSNTALIVKNRKVFLYKQGRLRKLRLTPSITAKEISKFDGLFLNNKELIAGSFAVDRKIPDPEKPTRYQAFRYEWRAHKKPFLNPLSSDFQAKASGINDVGEVVGESRKFGAASGSVGIWDKYGKFHVYVDQLGAKEAPQPVKRLLVNNKGLIVLSNVGDATSGSISYLSPKPGVLLRIDSLIVNPSEATLGEYTITAINDRGDMVGAAADGLGVPQAFVLLRQ